METERVRCLDVDDLYILTLLHEGKFLTEIAKSVRLSQAAVTQRIYKIQYNLGIEVLKKQGANKVLTEAGFALANTAKKALAVLHDHIRDIEYKIVPGATKRELKPKKDRHSCGFLGPEV